jgi:hypothetical protein
VHNLKKNLKKEIKMTLSKLTSILLIFGFITFSNAQEYEFILYEINPCNNQSSFSLNYHLEKDGLKYEPQFEDGIIKLKSKGKYNIKYEHQSIPITIDKERNSYSVELSRIQEFIVTHDKYGYIFTDCGKKLNGQIFVYYHNKEIKYFGKFKKGLAIGFLTELYPNGELKKIRFYDKKGNFIKNYFNSKKTD